MVIDAIIGAVTSALGLAVVRYRTKLAERTWGARKSGFFGEPANRAFFIGLCGGAVAVFGLYWFVYSLAQN